MRGLWSQKQFINFGRWPPLKWSLLCFVVVIALTTILSSPSPTTLSSSSASDVPYIFKNYRRLREQVAKDFLDIQSLSLGLDALRELEFCGRERENFVPCYNVTANLLAGFRDGDKYDRHCEVEVATTDCLVRPPKDYKIPLRWPAGRDVIWSSNVKITKNQFLSSGSMTKRLMLLEDNQIAFHSEEGMNFDSVKDYSRQIAEMIGLGSDSDLLQAGVGLGFDQHKRTMPNQFHHTENGRFNTIQLLDPEENWLKLVRLVALTKLDAMEKALSLPFVIMDHVHTVLDIGCGFGNFGAHLFSLKLMTVCVAAYEIFGSQVQLALERGLPAMLGSFVSRQLPYPSLSFDMVHCAQCGVTWDVKDGAFLVEVDRLLRPGGYFVLTSRSSKPQGGLVGGQNHVIFTFIEEYSPKICWSMLGQQDDTFIWQKTSDVNCYASRKEGAVPLCKEEGNVGAYYQPLLSCISGTTSKRWVPIQNVSHWIVDSQLSAEELGIHGVHPEEFHEDSHMWEATLNNYWSLLTPLIFSDHPKRPGDEDPLPPFNMIRNVMDMNAHFGGLNAAFFRAKKFVWVMNVVPTGLNTLPLIFDRGFVGVLHNWCEPFPTYPRTYDMLHATGLLSHHMNSEKCGLLELVLEMDRILRPKGWVVLHDKINVIEKARALAAQVRWDARVIELLGDNDHRLLVCQKPFLKK